MAPYLRPIGRTIPLVAAATLLIGFVTPSAARLVSGDTAVVLTLPFGNRPEGVAISRSGDLLVGNRQVSAATVVNQILRIDSAGTAEVFATLPESSPTAQGLLGLTVDATGQVCAALMSLDEHHGVWRISPDGTFLEHVAGSEQIAFPNALTFDARGNLYATDSAGGAIWRAAPGGAFHPWATSPLLAPLPGNPFGFPLPGANGIGYYPPDVLYVANTERSQIVRVRIEPDGSAGPVEAVTAPFAVPTVDGIAVDVHGQIHAALPGFSLLQTFPLVRIEPETGTVVPEAIDPRDFDLFDTPLSLAFGSGRWDARTLLVTNGDLPSVPGGPGPRVVQVYVGVTGFPIS